jgi:hypothetical protein
MYSTHSINSNHPHCICDSFLKWEWTGLLSAWCSARWQQCDRWNCAWLIKISAFSLKRIVAVDCRISDLYGISYDWRFMKNVVMKELLFTLVQIYRRSWGVISNIDTHPSPILYLFVTAFYKFVINNTCHNFLSEFSSNFARQMYFEIHEEPIQKVTSAAKKSYSFFIIRFLFSLLRIKGLYMFRALLAHPQEVLHKRHLIYCVRVMSVGCIWWPGDITRKQYTKCHLCSVSWR